MKIRPYSEKDFDGIVQLVQNLQKTDCWPIVYPEGWNEKRIKEEFEPMHHYRDSLFLVSESEEGITGLIAGHSLKFFISEEVPHLEDKFREFNSTCNTVFYQRDIMIHPAHQRGLTGFRLFKALMHHAVSSVYSQIVTRTPPQNLRGINFFERLGYVPIFSDNNPERIYFNNDLTSYNRLLKLKR